MRRYPKVAACAKALLIAVAVTVGIVPGAQAHEGGGPHDHAAAGAGTAGLLAPVAGLSSQTPLQRLSTAQAQAAPAHVLVFTETTQFRHTDAINQGTPKLRAALEAAGVSSEHTEDSAIFNDGDLARFDALVMFQTSGDPWTASEKAAMERYQRAGNGIVAIHNATDMRGNYTWWDNLIGALMPGHANTGTSPGPTASVIAEDQVHPSTKHLPDRWVRGDEWYNFSRNVRGDAHVLLTLDETSYDPGGNRMGYDHPISWCKPYDGGRAWVTGMGHFGAHYDEPALLAHIVGGVQWAAGVASGDCGGTRHDSFEKVALDENTSAPYALDVAPDGRVFFTELVRGQIRVWDPKTGNVSTAVTIPVYSGGEDGLLGIALSPGFASNGHVFVYHSPNSSNNADPANFKSRVSRFTVTPGTSSIDPASEKLIIEVPARREPDEPGHTGGGLDFDRDGNLLLAVGDDVNPHSEPSGGYAPLSERPGTFHDARATSANTNDLRGKLLRITPGADGGYTVPAGNLFPEAADTADKTRPEIYAMGLRNPFRFSVDPQTGWIALADYAPDSGQERPADRGPAGIVEWNLIKSPGNYGWPLCMGNNEPFRDVDYRTSPVTVGGFFDCANPVNDSIHNTGLTNLPPSRAPEMWYGYTKSSVQAVIPAGGGLAPMAGPFYDYDPNSTSDVKFPEYFDGKAFFYEWAKNSIYSMVLDDSGKLEKISRFLPGQEFRSPMDLKFGPDGALYTLEWGGGFGRDNPNSGIYRIDYISGSRSPVAAGSATPDNGQDPLQVTFSSAGSTDPEGSPLTYAWDFDGDGTTDSTAANPTHTYTQTGSYQARLTVTDPAGKTGSTVVPVTVGNTRPVVRFNGPVNGSFLDWGDTVRWDVDVTDPEDGVIDYNNLIVQPALGHDAHTHPTLEYRGKTGSLTTELGGGHSEDMKVFFALDARYTDKGDGSVPPLTGTDTVILQPKHKEAEHADATLGTTTAAATGDLEGGDAALTGLGDGDWAAYDPVNFTNTDSITFRVASTQAGGAIELRRDSPTGALLGTAAVPATGGTQSWTDVRVDAPDSTDTMALYLVFKGTANFRLNFWEVQGKGLSDESRPEVKLTSPTPMQALQPGRNTLVAEATDAGNAITKVEFFVDGAKVGEDTTAPYSVDWTQTTEKYYVAHAVATNAKGLSSDSRKVRFTIGEFGVRPPWTTFSSAGAPEATFDQLGNTFTVSAAGADVWQTTNQYGAVYLPGGAPENFVATVKVASFDGTHSNSKAGIIVRNDVTAFNTSPGYLVFGEMGSGQSEFLHDSGGNGQLNNDGEPVTNGCPGNNIPTWLKVEKFGTKFSVYCSKNGTTWTQVGVTTDIPSAAKVQDIGLFVTSHITGTKATAQFTDWALDTDPDLPDEPDPEPGWDTPPSCQSTMSDEFDGPLSTRRWTTVRGATGSMPATSNGSLISPVTNGDIDGGNAGAISYVGQPLPGGTWEATTKVTVDQDNEWQYAGLAVHVDDNNYSKLTFTENESGGRFVEFWSETNGSRTGHGPNATVPATFPTTIHLRLSSNGSTLSAAWSQDGATWTPIGSGPLKTGGTIGLLAAGDTDAQNVSAAFDYFRVTPDNAPGTDPAFDEEFDGTSLDGCRWDRVHHHRASRLKVTDGNLRITTFPADINGAQNGPIENLVLQTPPTGDWTVETKMTAPLQDNWQLGGLILYADDDHYVKYDVVADNAPGAAKVRRVELRYENGGALTGPAGAADLAPPASPTDTWWLRLTKSGNTYTGAISADGQTWTQTPGSVSVPLSNPGLGVFAIGPDQAAPIDVSFDYVRLVGADSTAPTTTATTAPAQPDGLAGWFKQAVSLTLATEAGATTEYRIGDGAYQAYTGPVALGTDGTRVITYRSRDAAGNVETAKTVTVKVDRTKPTSTATLDPAQPGTGGSYAGPVRVALAGADAGDGSGLDAVQYRLDGGAWTPYAGVVTVTGAGSHTLEHRSTDKAGNVGDSGTVTFSIAGGSAGAPAVRGFVDPDSGPAPLAVRFSATGVDPDGGTLRYEWSIGGGKVLDDEAQFTFTEPGVHTATVKVTDDEGDTATDTVRVTVTQPGAGNKAPVVEASVDRATGVAPHAVKFRAVGADADGPQGELEYSWDFGDGNGGSLARDPERTYLEPGTYVATVTVTDKFGASSTDTVTVTVSDPPANRAPSVRAAATPVSGRVPLNVLLSAEGTDPDGDDLTFTWDFGDGSPAGSGAKTPHVYRTAGVYTARVTARDAAGLEGSATVQIVIGDPPANQAPVVRIAADPTRGPAALTVRFTSSARDPEGEGMMYVWDFGDGGKAGGPSATHIYATPGTYTAKLTVTDAQGATATASTTITVSAARGAVRGASQGSAPKLTVPKSVKLFGTEGARLTVTCTKKSSGSAALTVSAATARKLGLAKRTVASRTLSCASGRRIAVRLKPSRAAARRLAQARRLDLVLRVSGTGGKVVARKVTIK